MRKRCRAKGSAGRVRCRLTLPSRGRPQAGFACLRPPLMSNVRPHPKTVGEAVNSWAVLLAAVSSFMLGGLWYSPALFGRIWNAENGGQKHEGHPAKVFGISFVFSLVAAAAFAVWLGASPSIE